MLVKIVRLRLYMLVTSGVWGIYRGGHVACWGFFVVVAERVFMVSLYHTLQCLQSRQQCKYPVFILPLHLLVN